jgi:hypothetical protein
MARDLAPVVELLVEHEYLRPISFGVGKPGRPSPTYAINPGVRTDMSSQKPQNTQNPDLLTGFSAEGPTGPEGGKPSADGYAEGVL